MSAPGSAPSPALSPGRAFALVAAGILGMFTGLAIGQAARAAGLPVGTRGILILSQALLALPAAMALRRLVPGWTGRSLSTGATAAAAASGFGLWVAGLGLLQVQQTVWPPPAGYLEAFQRLHTQLRPNGPLEAVASVAAIAIAPAICEEVLFRGALLPALLRWGRPTAVLVSALVFGLMHVDATGAGAVLYRVPFAFAIGVGLALLRLRSGSLLAPGLAHAVLNTLTFAVVAAGAGDTPAGAASPFLGVGMLAAGTLMAGLAVRRTGGTATLVT